MSWKTKGKSRKASVWLKLAAARKDDYPRLWEVTQRGACYISTPERDGPPEWLDRDSPFIARGLRWGQAHFLDPWIRKYGVNVPKPNGHLPERAVDGVKGNTLSGWKSGPGLPQWIELDLGRLAAVSGGRLYPAWGDGRETQYGCAARERQ